MGVSLNPGGAMYRDQERSETIRSQAQAPAEGANSHELVLTCKEAATYLKISTKTLRRLPIRCMDLGYRTKRYRMKDLLAFVEKSAR